MATLDKLVKESLKLIQSVPAPVSIDSAMTKREKMTNCANLCDGLCSQVMQSKTTAGDFAKYLTVAMEVLFTLLDDADLDVRSVADESMNRVIRSLMDTHCGRLQVELYKEIKKNGTVRCLRAALVKFGELSHLIRQQKCRAYVVNLLPCLVNIARRQEEGVHEALAISIKKILAVLGHFMNDNETRDLLKMYIANLFDSNPVIRRTTASCLFSICESNKKPEVFFPWLLSKLLDFLVPISPNDPNTPCNRILGILTCARTLLPRLADLKFISAASVGGGSCEGDLVERLLQLYELCLHYLGHQDHAIVTHALETLQVMLSRPQRHLKDYLTSPTGLSRSRIFDQSTGAANVASLSRMSSLMMSEEEESLLDLEPSFSEATPRGKVQMMMDVSAESASTIEPEGCPRLENQQQEVEEDSPEVPSVVAGGSGNVYTSESNFGDREGPAASSSPHFDDYDIPLNKIDQENIGHFCDADIPLIYAARKITLSFLLTKEKGVLTPGSTTRVSVKVLAFSCLTNILRLCPKVFLLTLLCDQDEEDRLTSLIRDVTNYSEEGGGGDPQLRGSVAVLLGTVIRGALIEGGGNLQLWFNERRPDQVDIVNLLMRMCEDSSSITLKYVLSGISLFLSKMLLSPQCCLALSLLERIGLLSSTKYWLVRQELCEIISSVPYAAVFYITRRDDIQNRQKQILLEFLSDPDQRVRSAAATNLVAIVDNLYYTNDDSNNDPVLSTVISMSHTLLHPIISVEEISDQECVFARSSSNTLTSGDRGRRRIFRCIDELYKMLQTSKNPQQTAGCVEALAAMAKKYPPLQNAKFWGCHLPRLRKASSARMDKALTSPGFDMLLHFASLMTKSSLATDIVTHSNLISISSALFISLAVQVSRGTTPDSDSAKISLDDNLDEVASILLHHCCRLFAIISSIVEEVAPVKAPPSAPAGGGGGGGGGSTSLSPLKKKPDYLSNVYDKVARVDDPKKIGQFSHSSHYMRLYDILKSIYAVHKISLGTPHLDKFRMILKEALKCVTSIFHLSVDNCVGKNRSTEEFLSYMKTNMTVEPSLSLTCVQCLLRCIFKTNSISQSQPEVQTSPSSSALSLTSKKGMFIMCFDVPYNELVHSYNLARDTASVNERVDQGLFSRSRLHRSKPSIFKALSRANDRAALASYIRLFEPLVIKALKHYTMTSDVEQQSQVLQLLGVLVTLRVNYCLLDSDQIFIGYVIRQLEQIEEGQVMNASVLIPNIFKFLILLSYEKYHSKPIIDIPKILRLCEGIFASGQSHEHVLQALIPVAEDLFCQRSTVVGGNQSELDTQREVVLNMLLKLIVYPEALQALIMILEALKVEGEEKWRKVSRMTMDVLLPLLANQKVRIADKASLDLVLRVFAALSPGCLRPVDPLLAAVLTCAVDLSNLEEVQCWLGFIVIALPILTSQSPEEGILSRLEELGIHVGNSSPQVGILDTSIESSASTSSDPLGLGNAVVKPEITFAKFLIQVIGAACSKFHQLIYLQTLDNHEQVTSFHFLQQELSHLLLFVSYMFQSGRYVRVTGAAQKLAREGDENDMMYTIETISELFLQLAHATPYLTLQWLYILILLNYCQQNFWSRVLRYDDGEVSPEQQRDVIGLHLEILRTSGLILYCDYLCDHANNVECTTWLVVNYVQFIVQHFGESPVQDFVMLMHGSQSSSALILQAISSRCEHVTDVRFLRETLSAVQNVHVQHIGKLLLFLVKKFLVSPYVSLARMANHIACQRLEAIVKDGTDVLPPGELSELLDLLRNSRKFPRLISILNKISLEYLELSPIEGDELRTFNPGSISNIVVDKDWFLSQLRQKCGSQQAQGEVCAHLLSSCEYNELIDIMRRKEFSLDVLSHCLLLSDKPGAVHLFTAARETMMQHVRAIVDELPKPLSVFYPEHWPPATAELKYSRKLEMSFQSEEFRQTLVQLLASTSAFLNSDSAAEGDGGGERYLARFGILGLEYVKWLTLNKISCYEDHMEKALSATAAMFKSGSVTSSLAAAESQDLIISGVFNLLTVFQRYLRMPSSTPIKCAECFSQLLQRDTSSDITSAVLACLKLNEIFCYCMASNFDFFGQAKDLSRVIESIVLGLCRMPLYSTYIRIPPRVWEPPGWNVSSFGNRKTVFPIIPVDLLQDTHILRDYIARMNKIGWISRQQFEEIWVSCLGVFSISKYDLTEEEIKILSQCSAFVAQALTSILMHTTYLPRPGQMNTSKPIHYARDSPSQFLLSPRGQQLTSVQNFIQNYIEKNCSEKQFLQVDCSLNLERCLWQQSRIGLAQVSISYIMSAIRHCEDTSESDARSNKSQAVSLPFLLRQDSLAAVGIDVKSCLHFLFDLYSQFLAHPSETPLVLLTETVRSIVMLSDLFTEAAHFWWMLKLLCEVQRVHPAEDDILSGLLCLGICKAVAVTGGDQETLERTRRGLEICARGAHLPARICALYGILYILQSEWIQADEITQILPLASEYLNNFMQDPVMRCEQHFSVMWSLAFFLLENFEHELSDKGDWASNCVQLAISSAGKLSTPHGIYLLLLSGLERLIVGGKLTGRVLGQVIKLATDLLTESNPALTIPAIQLFLAGMYSSTTGNHLSIETPSGGITDPERLMQAMEQMSRLFDSVRRSGPTEAKLLCEVLPRVLVDFFPAADVINRVISTFISPGQPHQVLLSGVLFSVFKQAALQEQTDMLQEWVLMALPNFTRRHPMSHSVWCLSCFFISASSHNQWLQAIYPHLQYRFGWFQHEDKKLFCLAAREFYNDLREERQRQKFRETFELVAQPNTPYYDLLQLLQSS